MSRKNGHFSAGITFLAQAASGAVVPLDLVPYGLRIGNALVSYGLCLRDLFYPANLGAFYPFPMSLPLWQPVASALGLFALSVLAWRWRQRAPHLFLGWFWFLGTFVPMIGLAQVGVQGRADRFSYLPSIGILVVCIYAAREWAARFRIQGPVLTAIAAAALASCILATQRQLSFWGDTGTLMVRTLAVTRENFMAHTTLGMFYHRQGRGGEALAEYREALRIQERSPVRTPTPVQQGLAVHLFLGAALEREGNPGGALSHYRAALRLAPGSSDVHNAIGVLLAGMNQPDEARMHYLEAMRLAPGDPLAGCHLGQLLVKLGRPDEGWAQFEAAAQLNPADARPYYFMGEALAGRGQSAEAVRCFREAARRDPGHVPSLTALAKLLGADKSGDARDAVEAVVLAERANVLTRSRDPSVLDTLARAYAGAGRFHDAQRTLQRAIERARAAGHTEDADQMQGRLEDYRAGRPHR
jgi:protein O-mannosyl-transferase